MTDYDTIIDRSFYFVLGVGVAWFGVGFTLNDMPSAYYNYFHYAMATVLAVDSAIVLYCQHQKRKIYGR